MYIKIEMTCDLKQRPPFKVGEDRQKPSSVDDINQRAAEFIAQARKHPAPRSFLVHHGKLRVHFGHSRGNMGRGNYSNDEQLPPAVPFDNPYEQLPAALFDIPSERTPIERPRAWKVIFYCY